MKIFNETTTQNVWDAIALPEDYTLVQPWQHRNRIRWGLTNLVNEPFEIINNLVQQISEDVKIHRAQELLALRSRPA